MKKHIPNTITLSNLTCGALATWQAINMNLDLAAAFIFLGAVFDFFDGMVARLLKVQSPMGKELDSLADIVTFGVAPAFIVFGIINSLTLNNDNINFLKYTAFLMPALSAYRLAKFNLDERQTSSFIGLPTPANAMVWAACGIIFTSSNPQKLMLFPFVNQHTLDSIISNPFLIAAVAIILSIMLVTEIPLFALKFKNLSWKDNSTRFIFLISSAALLIVLGILAIPVIILYYILLSIITKKKQS